MMKKLIIFDADYTLYKIDKTNAYKCMYKFLSKKLNITEEKLKNDHLIILNELKQSTDPKKRSYVYGLKILFKKEGIEINPNIIDESLEIFWKEIINDLTTSPLIKEIFMELKKNYALIIASDEFKENLIKKLNRVFENWRFYFSFLVTPEDVGVMKPSKKYYELVIQRTKLNADEIIVVGDSWERDLEPAKELGIKTVLVSSVKSGYPDHYITSIDNIIKII